MKYSVWTFFIFLILFGILNSCKKEKEDVNQTVYLLTKQSWTLVSIRQNINNSGWVDIYSGFSPCVKDNKFFFNTDYTYYWDEGFTKCSPTDPQTFSNGTWSLSSDGLKLFTKFGLTTTNVDITLLDNSNLVTMKNSISGLDTISIETKYIH